MGCYNIDIQGAGPDDKIYCTMWSSYRVTCDKDLTEEQMWELMGTHPILSEIREYLDEDGELYYVGLTSDDVLFSELDEDGLDYRDFDNYKLSCGWDGEDVTIVVDGVTFSVVNVGDAYFNINKRETKMTITMGNANDFIGWDIEQLNGFLDDLVPHGIATDISYVVAGDKLFATFEFEPHEEDEEEEEEV